MRHDIRREVEPYVRVIALNVRRARCRRASTVREVIGDLPDVVAQDELERVGIARDELRRVVAAFAVRGPSERVVLRDAACAELRAQGAPETPASMRMARMRPRRQLAVVLRAASAVAGIVAAFRGRLTVLLPAVTGVACASVVVMLAMAPPLQADDETAYVVAGPSATVVSSPVQQTVQMSTMVSLIQRVQRASSRTSRADVATPAASPARVTVPKGAEATLLAGIEVLGHGVQVKAPDADQSPARVQGVTSPKRSTWPASTPSRGNPSNRGARTWLPSHSVRFKENDG